jgi:hypothetical protein
MSRLLSDVSYSADCPKIRFQRPEILIVAVACKEKRGVYNPPIHRYNILTIRCTSTTNQIDGRETGIMLRFFAETYGKLSATKIIFTHAHDTSPHFRGMNIWDGIDRIVRTSYFRAMPFGNVLDSWHACARFRYEKGYKFAMVHPAEPWFNVTDIANYFFANTSFVNMTSQDWDMACCSTFFMDPQLILKHPRQDYLTVLSRIQNFSRVGYWNMFRRSPHGLPPRATQISANYLAGEVLERAWGMMFTGRGSGWRWIRFPRNITRKLS